MSVKQILVLVLVILSLFFCCQMTTAATEDSKKSASVRIVETDQGFAFFQGDAKIMFYQRKAKSLNGKYSRCNYVHPLYGLDGEILTEDFLHHRGIFWAWHQVVVDNKKIADGWILNDFSMEVTNAQIRQSDSGAPALKLDVLWKSPRWIDDQGKQKPFIKETTVIRAHPVCGDIRKIDFNISLLALADGVKIGGAENAKEYSGFSARIRLPKDLKFTAPGGEVKPARTPIKAEPWLDFSGQFKDHGNQSGLAILCHCSTPGFPQRWILRQANSMQNVVYPGRKPVSLSREKPLVLRYRLIVHRGNAQQINLNKLETQYNNETN